MSKRVQMRVGTFVCTLFLANAVWGQNDVQLSQQMFSRINYNPAATGLSEDLHLSALIRQQWVGYKDAPQTIVINGHTFVPWTQSGWGFTLVGDMLGLERSLNPKIRYAFHIPFPRTKSSLSLGVGAGIMYKAVDLDKTVFEDPNDPLRSGAVNEVKPDFDFGVEYNHTLFQVGASVNHLGNRSSKLKNTETAPHYYLYGRGMLDLTKKWQLSPALSWHHNGTTDQLEANLTLFMKKVFWVGASYRYQESAVFLAGAYITQNIMLGYSYDYSTISLRKYQAGSHEIMLSWTIPQPKKQRKARRMMECYHTWW